MENTDQGGTRPRGRDRARRRLTLGIRLVITMCAVLAATPLSAGAATTSPAVHRVLIVSLPGVAWPDLEGADIPNLSRLFQQSALGALATRTAGRRTSAGGGYLTIGAGSRTETDDLLVGQAFEPGEPYGQTQAAEVFAQRTGRRTQTGLLHLGIEALVAENAQGRFDPQLGALGDALARAHFDRGVIANADGAQPVVDGSIPEYQRAAVTALMTHEGVVPDGDIGSDLLVPAPGSPFGVRQNPDAVIRAFDRTWKPKSVVLVEASDLLRTDLYGAFETSEQQRAQKLDALRRTDVLVGRLLQRVDTQRDAVLVVGPTSGRGGGLAVAALRAPGVEPGLLRSATSRRTGVVYLADVAPTVIHLVGAARPAKMEGQAMFVRGTTGAARTNQLVQLSRDGLARDGRTTPLSITVVVLAGALAIGAVLALVRFPRGRPAVQFGALAILGFLAATYLAGPLHVGRGGNSGYWAFVFLVALVFAAACRLAGRGRPYAPILIALAVTVVLHLGDLLVGARLELNTVFGYSPTVGIRTAGEGNLTFAQLSAAVVLLSTLIVWRAPTRRVVYGSRRAAGRHGRSDGCSAVRRRLRGCARGVSRVRVSGVGAAGAACAGADARFARRGGGGRGVRRGLRGPPAPTRPAHAHRSLLQPGRARRFQWPFQSAPSKGGRQLRLVLDCPAPVGAADRRSVCHLHLVLPSNERAATRR